MSRPVIDLRETYRRQMLSSIGGWSGALITAIPTTVFVIVNVITTLRIAVISAVGAALVLTAYRFARKQPVQQALSGLFGVLIAAVIAERTGQARGFFLLGIITSFLYAVPFGVSIVVRRPLVGLLWEFLDPTPALTSTPEQTSPPARTSPPISSAADVDPAQAAQVAHDAEESREAWYRHRPLLVAYTWSTLAATLVFLLRGIVQLILYRRNDTGWLAVARIAMGYPLFIAAIGFGFLVVTRARRAMAATSDVDRESASD